MMCLCRPISLRLTQRFLIRTKQQQQQTIRMHAAQITVTTKETNANQPPKTVKENDYIFTSISFYKFFLKKVNSVITYNLNRNTTAGYHGFYL